MNSEGRSCYDSSVQNRRVIPIMVQEPQIVEVRESSVESETVPSRVYISDSSPSESEDEELNEEKSKECNVNHSKEDSNDDNQRINGNDVYKWLKTNEDRNSDPSKAQTKLQSRIVPIKLDDGRVMTNTPHIFDEETLKDNFPSMLPSRFSVKKPERIIPINLEDGTTILPTSETENKNNNDSVSSAEDLKNNNFDGDEKKTNEKGNKTFYNMSSRGVVRKTTESTKSFTNSSYLGATQKMSELRASSPTGVSHLPKLFSAKTFNQQSVLPESVGLNQDGDNEKVNKTRNVKIEVIDDFEAMIERSKSTQTDNPKLIHQHTQTAKVEKNECSCLIL